MKSTLAILVLVAAVKASPFPQAVTAIITPANGPSPPGCTPAYAGSFGIAVMNITSSQVARRNAPVSQITEYVFYSSVSVCVCVSGSFPLSPSFSLSLSHIRANLSDLC